MLKSIKSIVLRTKELRKINLEAAASTQANVPTRFVDKVLFEVYEQYLSNHVAYKDYTKEERRKYINIRDVSILLNNPMLHDQYIKKINEVYKKAYYLTSEDLKRDFDLRDFEILEQASIAKSDSELPEEFRKNKKTLQHKYDLCKEHSIVPLRRMSDNKKVLGLLKPTLITKYFWFEDIVFISPEIIGDRFLVKGLEFLEKDIVEDNISASEILNLLFQFMVDHNFSDVSYGLKDRSSYVVKGRRAGSDVEILSKKMNQSMANKITGEILRKGTGDRKNTKPAITTTIVMNVNNKPRNFRITLGRQSKAGVSKASFHRVVSIRILADNAFVENIENLNLNPKVVNFLRKAVLTKGGGMFIFAGETNSGKTTTMYSLLRDAQKNANTREGRDLNILTVDNGLEYSMDNMYQYDIQDTQDTDTPLTFAELIELGLRQDPDIFAIGEARSPEELRQCVNAGSRGAPSFMSLHASSPESSIQIFENIAKTPKAFFAGNIRTVLHMNLENALCQKCKGRGCERCNGTGEYGRVPIYDFIYVYPPLYGKDTFNANVDDIYNLTKLENEKKILRITKKQRAKELFDSGMISEKTYQIYSGDNIKEAVEKFAAQERI